MSSTREKPQNNEYYHVYNRGAGKQNIFKEKIDLIRFLKCLTAFNSVKPVASLFEAERLGTVNSKRSERLVEIVAYCLNRNHYHLILRQVSDNGISEFMKRLGGGYTCYINEKYDSSGVLFQGKYKHKHIDSDEYLKYLSAYVNLNYKVHLFRGPTPKSFYASSWFEYVDDNPKYNVCSKDIILGQFKSKDDYKTFANEALEIIRENKESKQEVEFTQPHKKIFKQE